MKRLWLRVRVPLLIFLVALIIPSTPKTSAFFSLSRAWYAHWPFEVGRNLPNYATVIMGRFVPVWAEVKPHVNMLLDPYDAVTGVILSQGTWEPATLQVLEEHMPPGGTFIDVGAHVGWYSLNAVQRVGQSGHVIAVEPNPATLNILNANIKANNADGVISVAPVACSDAEGILSLYSAPRSNTGESSLSAANASQQGKAEAVQVRARTLDDIVRESGVSRVDVIKVDVEGADYLVLKGAAKTLDRFRPAVVVEVIEHQLNAMGTSEKEIVAFMSAHGYTAKRNFELNIEFVPSAQ